MAREYELYRLRLEELNALFPGKLTVDIRELSGAMGGKSERTLRKMFNFKNGEIPKVDLAHRLSQIWEGNKDIYINK